MSEYSREPYDDLRRQAVMRREGMAVDSILENENLSAELEDEAARPLINWGVNWAKRIARDTSGLDDTQAEEAMLERMRATRHMMRSIDLWVANQENMTSEEHAEMLAQVIEQAAVAYGEGFIPPDAERCQEFLGQFAQLTGNQAGMVAELSRLFEQAD